MFMKLRRTKNCAILGHPVQQSCVVLCESLVLKSKLGSGSSNGEIKSRTGRENGV